jgi:hypothetical protein
MNHEQIDRTLKLLSTYSCSQSTTSISDSEKEQLRQALLLIVDLSEWQNLGICADNSTQGFAALSSYLKAFGYQSDFNTESVNSLDEPVYIKFNSQRMTHYLDSYSGEYRGVLVACQAEDDRISGTYGHFPLDLFNN